MTLIVLLILAAVSLSSVFSEKGIFSRAEKAGNRYNEAKAREVLETVLLADGQYEKNINPEYNQDDFLNTLITTEIPESRIIEGTDVAVVDGWAFELDRTVPKIGRPLGRFDNLVFPTVEIISGPTLTNKGKAATFTAKATETTKGITRIELWLEGKRIEKETITYDTPQTEIIKEFTVNKNGTYTVKAYANLMGSTSATVIGIVPAISFTPNGSTEWKKQHTTQIIVEATNEKITEMEYVWVKDDNVNEPADNLFKGDCLNDRTVTGGDDSMTGIYYLWVMLKTATGTNICASKAFKFDNEKPTAELTSTPVSETSFTLISTASDNYSGIEKYELYIDGEKKEPTIAEDGKATYTWDGTEMTEKECYIIVVDKAKNKKQVNIKARTKMYTWTKSEKDEIPCWTVDLSSGKSYAANHIRDGSSIYGWLNMPENFGTGSSPIWPSTEFSMSPGSYYYEYGTYKYWWEKESDTQIARVALTGEARWWVQYYAYPLTGTSYQIRKNGTTIGPKEGTEVYVYGKNEEAYPKKGELGDYWFEYIGIT